MIPFIINQYLNFEADEKYPVQNNSVSKRLYSSNKLCEIKFCRLQLNFVIYIWLHVTDYKKKI